MLITVYKCMIMVGMKVKIQIDTRTFVRFWLVVIGFVLAGFLIYSARIALLIIGLSVFFAVALSPYVNKLAKLLSRKKERRGLSTAIAYLTVVAVLVAILVIVVPPIVEQMSKFMRTVPALLDSLTHQSGAISHLFSRYGFDNSYQQLVGAVRHSAAQIASFAGTNLVSGITSIASVIAAAVIVFILTFLMLVEGPTWIDHLWGLYSNRTKMTHHKKILSKIYTMLTSYITGQLTVAILDGAMAGIVVFILSLIFHVPSGLAIPSATIAFVMYLIPIFGPIIGAVVIFLVLLLNNVQAAVAYLIYFMIYEQIEGNIIAPRIQSKRLSLSPMIVLIAVVIGIYMFGILGGIISVPIAGCINILVEDLYDRNRVGHEVSRKVIRRTRGEID